MRRATLASSAIALVVGTAAVPIGAAEDPPAPPTTPPVVTTAPPSTAPPPTSPPETEPPPPAPPPSDAPVEPPLPPDGIDELPPEDVPHVEGEVPPAPVPPGTYAREASQVVQRQLSVARIEQRELEVSYGEARDELVRLQDELAELEEQVAALAGEDRAAIRRVEAARKRFEARAADSVTRGDPQALRMVVVAKEPNELAVADALLEAVLDADQDALTELLAAKAEIDDDLVRTAEQLVQVRAGLDGARETLFQARRDLVAAQFDVAVLAAGSDIVIRGFVFPVGEPRSFGDSFGAPRMMGTEYEHAHQGTDILAPTGTPLYACERGIITRMGSDVLGGTKLWIKGESGTYYYYAHLSAFAEGMHDGRVVDAGDVVGFVGDTGNARGGPPHLHFQVHPNGGAAVNPYPLLKVVDELQRRAAQAAGSR